MKPEHLFHSYVTAVTVACMYLVISHIVPLLTLSSMAPTYVIEMPVMLLLSYGIYNTLAKLLLTASRRFRFVKRHLLGSYYLHGTWVGKYQTLNNSTVYTVEYIEQSLSSLNIRGLAFLDHEKSYANWNSIAETVDTHSSILTYTYTCQKKNDVVLSQGISVFQLHRENQGRPPNCMHGYSTDLSDSNRTENQQKKVSEDLITIDLALKLAKQS